MAVNSFNWPYAILPPVYTTSKHLTQHCFKLWLRWGHVSFDTSLSQAASSRSRGKGHGSVIRGGRERGGIRCNHAAQRTRMWVSFCVICFSFSLSVCLALLFLLNTQRNFSTQTEMSSTDTESKHKSYSFGYYYNKYVITIVMFWPTWHVLNAAAAWEKWNVLRAFTALT